MRQLSCNLKLTKRFNLLIVFLNGLTILFMLFFGTMTTMAATVEDRMENFIYTVLGLLGYDVTSKFKRRWRRQRKSHQTKIGGSTGPPIFFCFLVNPREISRFCDIHNGLVLPFFRGWTSPFFAFDHMFDHLRELEWRSAVVTKSSSKG